MNLEAIENKVEECPELKIDESLIALIALYKGFRHIQENGIYGDCNNTIHTLILRDHVVEAGYTTDSNCEHLFQYIFDYDDYATINRAVQKTLTSIYMRIFYLTHKHQG